MNRRPLIVVSLSFMAACSTRFIRPPVAATLTEERKTAGPSAPSRASYIFSDSPEIQEAVKLYTQTGVVSVNWWKIGRAHCPAVDQLNFDAMRPPSHSISC